MRDLIALGIVVAVILAAIYAGHEYPSTWPAAIGAMCAAGVACLAYFWATGDDL